MMKVCRLCNTEVHYLRQGICDPCEKAAKWPKAPETCEHDQLFTSVAVNRISRVEGGPITDYVVDVELRCIDCGTVFAFLGVDRRISIERPCVNIDATVLSVPMMPGARSIFEQTTITVDMPGPVKVSG